MVGGYVIYERQITLTSGDQIEIDMSVNEFNTLISADKPILLKNIRMLLSEGEFVEIHNIWAVKVYDRTEDVTSGSIVYSVGSSDGTLTVVDGKVKAIMV